jgi:glycosyltransferase involved in cell wall biosynthesis
VDICTVYARGAYADALARDGVTVHSLDIDPDTHTSQPCPKYTPRIFFGLTKIICDGGYNVVHAHLFPSTLFVALVSTFVHTPRYFASEHSVNNRRRHHLLGRVVDRAIYQRYEHIVAVGGEVRTSLLQWLPGLACKTSIVPNAIDTTALQSTPEQVQHLRDELHISETELVVLYAGRLVPAKGPDVLVTALAQPVLATFPMRVLIAGDGPLRKDLEARLQKVGLSSRVTLLGLRTDMATLLHLADLVVMPSRWEGLPMTLLESMATRTPVLATSVGGTPEVVEHGRTAWLVPPDDPRSLGEAFAILLRDPKLREHLAAQAYTRVRNDYSIESAVSRLLEIYSRGIVKP